MAKNRKSVLQPNKRGGLCSKIESLCSSLVKNRNLCSSKLRLESLCSKYNRSTALRTRIEALVGKLNWSICMSKRSSHSNAYFFGLPWVSALCHNDIIWGIKFSEQTYCDFWYSHSTIKACQSWSCTLPWARALVLSSLNKIDGYFSTPSLCYSRSLCCIPACFSFSDCIQLPFVCLKESPSNCCILAIPTDSRTTRGFHQHRNGCCLMSVWVGGWSICSRVGGQVGRQGDSQYGREVV